METDRLKRLFGQDYSFDWDFPQDRLSQAYEQYVVSRLKELIGMQYCDSIRIDAQQCKVALKHLRVSFLP